MGMTNNKGNNLRPQLINHNKEDNTSMPLLSNFSF